MILGPMISWTLVAVTDVEYTHISYLFIIAEQAAVKQNPQHKI